MDRLHIDVVGPFPTSTANNRFIITAVCRLSRFPFAVAVPDHTVRSVLGFLITVFAHFGFPAHVTMDNAAEFVSHELEAALLRYGVVVHHSLPYHPQGNAPVERFHKLLNDRLAILARATVPPQDWDEVLTPLLYALRRRRMPVLQNRSPFEVVFGRAEQVRVDRWLANVVDTSSNDVVASADDRSRAWCVLADFDLETRTARYARRGGKPLTQWAKGDPCYWWSAQPSGAAVHSAETNNKLAHPWAPCVVLEVPHDDTVVIAPLENPREQRITHARFLKRRYPDLADADGINTAEVGSDSRFEVYDLLDEKDGKILVLWRNFTKRDASWEPSSVLEVDCPDMVAGFRRRQASGSTPAPSLSSAADLASIPASVAPTLSSSASPSPPALTPLESSTPTSPSSLPLADTTTSRTGRRIRANWAAFARRGVDV